jgi:hypothetical protein
MAVQRLTACVAVVELTALQPIRNTIVKNKTQNMRTKDEIERSLAEMKRMADDARRGLAKAKEMNATVLVKHFEQWETKCEARAQILSWVLGEQELSEDVQPQLPQANVMRGQSPKPLPEDAVEFITNALGEEMQLRQMIDLWCIDQLGNTEEAREKADAMFTAARDIFYRSSGNGA